MSGPGVAAYTLYNRLGSGGLVVEAALALANATVKLIDLDSRSGTPLPDSFRAINPWGQVPTLVLPDGTLMTECAAILIHIAAAYPERELAPRPGTSAHASFLRWTVFLSVNVHECAVRGVYPERFSTDASAAGGIRDAAIARGGAGLALLDAQTSHGPFILGADMSLVDVYAAMLFGWFGAQADAARLAALTRRVRGHPVLAPIWRRHGG